MSDINEVRYRLADRADGFDAFCDNGMASDIRSLLDDHARLKEDAERWRFARTILTIEAIEDAASITARFTSDGGIVSEGESIRADQAIDAAKEMNP